MKWIPMSERLPENGHYYLWCSDMGSVQSDYYWDGFEKEQKYGYNIVAWMPLPRPYTADRKTEPTQNQHIQSVESVESVGEDRKTENSSEKPNNSTISKMEQVDKDINVRSKDEPQTDYDKGLQQLREIVFDKEKTEQLLKECEAMGIKTDCAWR